MPQHVIGFCLFPQHFWSARWAADWSAGQRADYLAGPRVTFIFNIVLTLLSSWGRRVTYWLGCPNVVT